MSKVDFTLYALSTESGGGVYFSPFVWKTKLDLAILDISPSEEKLLTWPEIRGDLARETGNDKVTVPTLKLSSREYLTDSWVIAEYLEKTYAKGGKTLFPGGETTKCLVRFLDGWADEVLADEVYPVAAVEIYNILDDFNKKFWEQLRYKSDTVRCARFLSNGSDPEFVSGKITKARAVLQVLEDMLKWQIDRNPSAVWLAGEKPSHADSCVAGWYVYSRVSKRFLEEVWEWECLPLVKAWVERVNKLLDAPEMP